MRLQDLILALLFASESPVSAELMAQAVDRPVYEVEEALEALGRRLALDGPLQVVRLAGGFQLATKSEFAPAVARLLEPRPLKLSQAMLEVLAVVAYRQPITSAEIQEVRGVDSDYSLKQLLDRRLVMETGRRRTPGRPIEYGTTSQFLHQFNLNSLQDLPQLAVGDDGSMLAIGPETPQDQLALELEAEE
ncbi:MAG: SMC-Scp complex subunit ScpB [Fimbriimonadaceae bacterium]|nr:SMC-Scp complex subunit ScpB [Fimbriimonadaceae bacterium]